MYVCMCVCIYICTYIYSYICFDVFSKFVNLYSLKAATTKACLNKIQNNYVINVTRTKRVGATTVLNLLVRFGKTVWQT